MPKFQCVTCGTQYPESEKPEPPATCLICQDERQYVSWKGQKWTTLEEMQSSGYKNYFKKEEGSGLYSVITRPDFAIGQRAFLVQTKEGNVLWDCLSHFDQNTREEIERFGGLQMIAISHPHYYSSMVEWSDAFGGIPIYIHELDKEWVVHPSLSIILWKGESISPVPEITLVNLGGHFDGGTVLHWAAGAEGKGTILSGDIVQVVQDRRWASFMYSYPNLIPLSKSKIRQISGRISKYGFESVYSAFEGKEILSDGHEAVKRSAERYIQHISD